MSSGCAVKLPRLSAEEVRGCAQRPVDNDTLQAVRRITDEVRDAGESAVRRYAERFGEREPGDALVLTRADMSAALDRLDDDVRELLERGAERIRAFADAQREMFRPVTVDIPGGQAGHTVECVRSAGCYAPAGRHPLPSSVLMTAVTARAAGCERVVVASPSASDVMLGAAAVAGADSYLCVGGAHAVAALAYGFDGFERVDLVVGPGNKWVTGAKQVLSGEVGIDMLAGPSELLVIADGTADAEVVAADLLAQAEHDVDARAMLVTTDGGLADAVDDAIGRRLESLSTSETARAALQNGFCCVVASVDDAIRVSDRVGAEHVEVQTSDPDAVADRLADAGGVFIGAGSAEVFGDYCAGPNHTLPTGGTSRFTAGLSVAQFLRLRTWLRVEVGGRGAGELAEDAARFGMIEGLEGHALSARIRG